MRTCLDLFSLGGKNNKNKVSGPYAHRLKSTRVKDSIPSSVSIYHSYGNVYHLTWCDHATCDPTPIQRSACRPSKPTTDPFVTCQKLCSHYVSDSLRLPPGQTGPFPALESRCHRPWEVHASQWLKVGLYTPTILGGNSYLSWFYDRGAIKGPAHTGTSKGLSQAMNRGPIRKFQSSMQTIQSHGLSAGARTHYVTANGVRNGQDAIDIG